MIRSWAGVSALVLILAACSGESEQAPAEPSIAAVESQPTAPRETRALSRQELAAIGLISSRHFQHPDRDALSQALMDGQSLQAVLSGLDPYSQLLSAEEAKLRRLRAETTRTGVGLDILFDQQRPFAVGVPGTPFADAFGVDQAYALDSLDGRAIDLSDIHSYRALIASAVGESLSLRLAGKEEVSLPVVTYNNAPLSFSLEQGVPVVRVRQFAPGQSGALAGFLREHAAAESLIVDLRFSPGGDLFAMNDWLSLFLPEGTEIGEIASGDGEHRKLSTLAGTLTLPPVTLRVSRFTASSAEIFAHALKAHLPGTRVVGEATRGKCLVQQRFGLADGSELVLSTGQFLMEGRPCEGRPLQAD